LQQLYGHGRIAKGALEDEFAIDFDAYFAAELRHLDQLVEAGLVVKEPEAIRVTTPLGRLLVRVVAAVFDHYLPAEAYREGLPIHLASKVG
jgi:oxygen-independent coproporphyrinogen-3 oxidase